MGVGARQKGEGGPPAPQSWGVRGAQGEQGPKGRCAVRAGLWLRVLELVCLLLCCGAR